MEHLDIAQRFDALFSGLRRAYGTYTITGSQPAIKKVSGRAVTTHGEVTIEMWSRHLRGEQGLGIVPIRDDATCVFGAIDIDEYPLDIVALEARCAALNLPLFPTRTKSGGCHLYLFMAEPTPAKLVRSRLAEFSVALGFSGVEVFPKQNNLASTRDVGNWINMPYFGALVGDTERHGILKGAPVMDAEAYLERADRLRVTAEQLQAIELKGISALDDGPPCLQVLAQRGFPEGTRNNGLFNLGVYARKRYPDTWKDELQRLNNETMRPPLGYEEVAQVIKSLDRKTYGFTCDKAPCANVCNKTLCRTRQFGIGGGDMEFNVVIDNNAVKVLTDPPYWILTVDGVRVEVTAEVLLSQEKFRKMCVERISKVPSRMKPVEWDKQVQRVLENAEQQEAPQDASDEGTLMFYVEEFCTQRAQAQVRADMLAGKPWTENGRTYFRSGDLVAFLALHRFYDLNKRQIYAALRKHGCTHHTFNEDGKCLQVWSINEFATRKVAGDGRPSDL